MNLMPVDVVAPPLGTTVDTVTLVNWYKQEGETVRAGEPLFAVETDKATLDVEAPASGILRLISCQAGNEVKVLSRIAVIALAAPSNDIDALRPLVPGVLRALAVVQAGQFVRVSA